MCEYGTPTSELVLRPLKWGAARGCGLRLEEGGLRDWGSDKQGGGNLQPWFTLLRRRHSQTGAWRARVHGQAGRGSTGPLNYQGDGPWVLLVLSRDLVGLLRKPKEAGAWSQPSAAVGVQVAGAGNGSSCLHLSPSFPVYCQCADRKPAGHGVWQMQRAGCPHTALECNTEEGLGARKCCFLQIVLSQDIVFYFALLFASLQEAGLHRIEWCQFSSTAPNLNLKGKALGFTVTVRFQTTWLSVHPSAS